MKNNKTNMTAVEWLSEKYDYVMWMQNMGALSTENADKCREEYLQKAKEVEKEQIVNAHLTGLIYSLETDASTQAEQYYNDNFS
jgi:hypothetical protein